MKNISPTIWKNDFAGLAKENNSTMTPFHKSFPTNARMTKLTTNARIIATPSAYTSFFWAGVLSAKPSTATRAALAIGEDAFIFSTRGSREKIRPVSGSRNIL